MVIQNLAFITVMVFVTISVTRAKWSEIGRKRKGAETHLFSTPSLLSGLLDSNQRPRAPQTCALPTALNPEHFCLAPTSILSNAGAKVHTFSESAKFSGNFLFFFLNFTPLRLMNSNNIRIFACSTIRYNRNGTI